MSSRGRMAEDNFSRLFESKRTADLSQNVSPGAGRGSQTVMALPLAAVGGTLGTVAGLLAICVLALLCRCSRKRAGVSKSPEKAGATVRQSNIVPTAQQFSLKKTTEPVQPRTRLTTPKIYTPEPVVTSPEFINYTDYTLGSTNETTSVDGGETDSLMADTSGELFIISKNAAVDAASLSDDLESEISEDWLEAVKLHYATKYNYHKSELHLTIIEAQFIDTVENMNYCDIYVVGTLVTKLGKTEAETSNQTKTLFPVWQETLIFPVSEEHLRDGILMLALYSYDRYSRHYCVGEAQLHLLDMPMDARTNLWINLKAPEKDSVTSPGEILLSINYLPAANRLIVVVMKARHLNSDELKHLIDVSVKLTLMHQSVKLKKKRTRHVKHKINPVWNEMIMFEVPYELLFKSYLEIEMLNQDCTGQHHLLGKCSLGLNSSDLELSHWQEMLNKPRKQIAMWHKLHA
ncbi:synaptotagmin-13 [Chiloscyllium plagiosum]|uniref:synaptotagmin-13 n=1 Tax=Chiloscyllium plagiosum TaxID=36176 RepID=UPI001CB8060E|nr:synaptotagmin-13 [Chiloscyllium plagiosum]